ncbi:hypothetical protein [Aeromonas veronii]|nr:hypothetical protein [Aeromonas veronii]
MKYDSTDVLKSVVDRLENLNAIGIFKAVPPPFDPASQVWRYNIKALSMEERKLFVLFRLEEIFADAVQRGEQDDVVEVVILDEAHIYADDDPDNIINNIAKEARKFGLAMICASQSPPTSPKTSSLRWRPRSSSASTRCTGAALSPRCASPKRRWRGSSPRRPCSCN